MTCLANMPSICGHCNYPLYRCECLICEQCHKPFTSGGDAVFCTIKCAENFAEDSFLAAEARKLR